MPLLAAIFSRAIKYLCEASAVVDDNWQYKSPKSAFLCIVHQIILAHLHNNNTNVHAGIALQKIHFLLPICYLIYWDTRLFSKPDLFSRKYSTRKKNSNLIT